MKLRPSVSRRTYIIGITLFLLAALFGYYFLAHLPQKENRIIAQRVRALDRIGHNFQAKYEVYEKNVSELKDKAKTQDSTYRQLSKIRQEIKQLYQAHPRLADSLENTPPDSSENVASLQAKLDSLKKREDSLENILFEQSTTNQNIYPIQKNSPIAQAILLSDSFATDFEPFFTPLMLKNSFDGYIVYQDSDLIYQDIPGEVLRVPAHLYTELNQGDEREQRFARYNLQSRSPEQYAHPRVYEAGIEVQLASIDYRLFCTDFRVGNTPWTIYGLVTQEHFDTEAKKISFFSILLMSLGLLLLLCSMPLMKLFFMSSIERLHRQDAFLTPQAFLFSSSLLMLMVMVSSKFYLSDIPKVDDQLEKLADTVAFHFDREIKDIHLLAHQLKVQPVYFRTNEDSAVHTSAPIEQMPDKADSPEVFKPFSTVSIAQLLADSTFLSDSTSFPDFTSYPFLRFMYWLDAKGRQQFEYSMLDEEHYYVPDSALPNYAERSYFKTIRQGGGYPLTGKDSLSFLESIVSWTTGDPISVISLPLEADRDSVSARGNKNSRVLAVSTVLYSVTDPVLPPGYSFNIIDREGLVLYHAERQKNLQENFLQEVDYDQHLLAALVSESEATTDVSYYHHRYRAHLKPLPNVPWYIITTYDREYLESPYQYILTFSTLGIGLISLVAALQFVLIFLIYHRLSKLKRKSFVFEWLWPYQRIPVRSGKKELNESPRPVKYAIVVVHNLIYGIVLLIYNQSDTTTLIQTLSSFLMAVVFSYVCTFALLKEDRDYRYGWVLAGSLALTLLILLINVALNTVPSLSHEVPEPYMFGWLVLLFAVLFYVTHSTFKTLAQAKLKPFRWKRSQVYAAFFIGLLIIALLLLNQRLPLRHATGLLRSVFLWACLYLLTLISIIVGNYMDKLARSASNQETADKREGVSANVSGLGGHRISQWLTKGFTALSSSPWFSRHSYCLMIFSYLILGSFLSVWFLSSKTYEYEKRVWHRYNLYQVNEGLKKREARLQDLYQWNDPTFESINQQYRRLDSVKRKALYYTPLHIHHSSPEKVSFDSTQLVTMFDSLMLRLRPVITHLTAQTNGFILPYGEDWEAVSGNSDSLTLSFENNPYFVLDDGPEKKLALATVAPKFFQTSWFSLLIRHSLPILGFLAVLFGIYWLLKFIIMRLFGVQAFQFQRVIQIDDDMMDYERDHPGHPHPQRAQHKFIISMPFAGAEDLYGPFTNSYTSRKIDLSQALEDTNFPTVMKDALQQKRKEVVLEHFSYGIDDRETNQRRLSLLENLLANGNSVTIISKLTPMQITAKYEELIEKANTQSENTEELETRVSRWKDILSSFVKLYYSKLVCNRERRRLPARHTVRDMIIYEMSVNRNYFERMNGTMVCDWNDCDDKIELSEKLKAVAEQYNEDIKEEVLLKIQSMAQPFYFSLWNTCSKEEKYILYDLADDGFVNTENKQVLLRLMEKGLIFYDESFHIMNESFRNFILSNIKTSEALEMESEVRKNGRWSIYSTVILIMIVSLIFFVVFAHESIVNQFIALLAGVTAAVPYLLRLIGLVGLSSKVSE